MRFVMFLLLALGAAHVGNARADTLRCNGSLVQRGDWDFQVDRHCGAPYFVDRWQELRSTRTGPGAAVSQLVEFEDRYYDFGSSRFIARARVVQGRVAALETLTTRGSPRPGGACNLAALRANVSPGEVVMLCGSPARRIDLAEAVRSGQFPGETVVPTRRERWVYPAGSNTLLLVELLAGRVQSARIEPLGS